MSWTQVDRLLAEDAHRRARRALGDWDRQEFSLRIAGQRRVLVGLGLGVIGGEHAKVMNAAHALLNDLRAGGLAVSATDPVGDLLAGGDIEVS